MQKSKNFLKETASFYFKELKTALDSLSQENLDKASQMILDIYRAGKKIVIFGNGGSAATASHLACDFSKGTPRRGYRDGEKRLKVLSLTENTALITAFSNDLSFKEIFVEQLKNLLEEGDLMIILSVSGNSANLIKAVDFAKKKKAKTIGFLGFKKGGKLKNLVDCAIVVQSNYYGPVEDVHLILGHLFAMWFASVKKQVR